MKRKSYIIEDLGYFKILTFSFGVLFYFTSNLFSAYTNYFDCSLNFLLKHLGISLMLVIYLLYILPGIKLGIETKEDKKLQLINVDSSNDKNSSNNLLENKTDSNESIKGCKSKLLNNIYETEFYRSNSKSNDNLDEIDSKIREIEFKINIVYGKVETEGTNASNLKLKNKNDKYNNSSHVIRCIKQVHSLFIEVSFIYPICVAFIILFIIYIYFRFNKNKYDFKTIKDDNGYWVYKCDLEKVDFFLNWLHLIVMIILLINGKKLFKYQCIFKCTRYITYSLYVSIATGPLVNVIYLILYFIISYKN